MGKFQKLINKDKREAFSALMAAPISPQRHKAIGTIMRKHNISYEEARKRQALKIIGEEQIPQRSNSLGRLS